MVNEVNIQFVPWIVWVPIQSYFYSLMVIPPFYTSGPISLVAWCSTHQPWVFERILVLKTLGIEHMGLKKTP